MAEKELAAKVAASFGSAEKPQVPKSEAIIPQPDHKAEAAATEQQLNAIKDTISDLPGQVAQVVSAPARQVADQISGISHPDNAEKSIDEAKKVAQGPFQLQDIVNKLRPAHIDAHNDLEHQEQAA